MFRSQVVPYVGTWIEIRSVGSANQQNDFVVPYVGTWIEMARLIRACSWLIVVPYVGTWIEIFLDF